MTGITEAQRAALTTLSRFADPETYLAGGIAAAVIFDHRSSYDLDLFVPHDFDPERFEERLVAVSDLRVTGRARGTLHLEVSGVPTSILSYRYQMLSPTERREGIPIPVASSEDLACMKVSAIAGRGAAKDFWDLHALLEHGVLGGDLRTVLESFARKFPIEDIGHAVRALAYFGDADAAPLPLGLSPASWQAIKAAFALRVRTL